jgi:sortase A
VLLVIGGISAYPSLNALGASDAPQGFGDEAELSASIVQANEALPPPVSDSQPTPAVLPETPLQAESTATPDIPATLPPPTIEPTPTVEPTAANTTSPTPTAVPTQTPPATEPDTPQAPNRLVIPAIGLDAPVVTVGWSVVTQNGQQMSMWDVPNRHAAGWLKTSARAGERGNTVLDGHHNIAGEVFRDLVDLKEGDAIQLWAGDQAHDYVVSLLKILPEKGQPTSVRLENAKWIQPTADERLTLVTCWPYTNNTHRLVVVAVPADRAPRKADGVEE